MSTLATIGYEGETQPQVIERLMQAGVEVLIDVRAVAASRRAGFSKTLLAASLKEAGIDYVHLRQLGTPKPGREAARKGRIAEMRAIYEEHLREPAAQLELAKAAEIAKTRKAALLCFEPTPPDATGPSSPNASAAGSGARWRTCKRLSPHPCVLRPQCHSGRSEAERRDP